MDVRPDQPFPFNHTGYGSDHVFSYRVHGPRTANGRKAILMAKGRFSLTLNCGARSRRSGEQRDLMANVCHTIRATYGMLASPDG